MDYKKLRIFYCLIFAISFFSSCISKEKQTTENTFYVELVNFNHDSLKKNVASKIFGKVSFFKNNQREIVSINYVDEGFEKMHYFRNFEELDKNIRENSKKIRVEFGGTFTRDSISYSLQKFVYKNKVWNKYSDMGFLKATNTYYRAREFAVDQYGKQIQNEIVNYSYN